MTAWLEHAAFQLQAVEKSFCSVDNIEQHQVLDDHFETPNKYLNTTWVFRTKPATTATLKEAKAQLCIQGLSQPALITKGLELLNLIDRKPVKTPLIPGLQLHAASEVNQQEFQSLGINYGTFTGILNYLACRTRSDLAEAFSIISRFNQKPGMNHWKATLLSQIVSIAFWKSCPILWNSKKQKK
ncbi:hypothetical protein VP01_2865g1 [Puccinia sorghi]|uniref:Reverse transcriptase Ty1/copia-type domain-containing protein n=1 Tax=Puccinia sorghi TaxID=27349 RepID=A0A0L6V1V9_9BASI|nr:hypothetical protein VP01_2865g1 [Puccinia sorghi]